MPQTGLPLLSVLIWLPILGGACCLLLGNARADMARWLGLAFALATLALSVPLLTGFDHANAGMQFVEQHAWIPAYDIRYHLGADGISVALIALTTLTTVLALIGAWGVDKRVSQYYAAFLLLEGLMIGVFCAMDAMLFYVFFEAMLIPMFVIIGVWGGPRRVYASLKFFLYTFLGSVFMLVGLIWLYLKGGSWQLADLAALPLTMPEQAWLFFAFLIAFAVKVPMFPVHTWLPDAHVEAPTAGSVILAGVLLKMGTYGFMKLGIPLFPSAAQAFAPAIAVLAVISIVYGACLALVQTDIKKIVAYSSVSHLGYVMLGLATASLVGIQGAIVQMVSHGLVAGGLFLMVGMIYERRHTRELAAYGGLARLMPAFALFFMLLTLASIGLPTTSGFTGEFMVLLGAFETAWPQWQQGEALPLVLAASAVLGVVLGAWYMLAFAQRLLFGEPRESHGPAVDLGARERLILALIVAAVFAIGLHPQPLLERTEAAAREYQALLLGAAPAEAPR